jgi:hypothetical protein
MVIPAPAPCKDQEWPGALCESIIGETFPKSTFLPILQPPAKSLRPMDLEREPLQLRYRLCGLGFSIAGIALGLLCVSSALNLIVFLTGDMWLWGIQEQSWWSWLVGAPITCGALVGSYLLWGRWTDSSWQRRAGLLVLLNLFDFIIWTYYQGEMLGLRMGHLRHDWVINNLTSAFGWIEFLLFASLASEVAAHLGMPGATEAGQSASNFALVGLLVSLIWRAGWPLEPKIQGNPLVHLMLLGFFFLRTICSLQVAALCLVAGRYCRKTCNELRKEEEENDPFQFPEHSFDDFPAARSDSF